MDIQDMVKKLFSMPWLPTDTSKNKVILHKIPGEPCKMLGTDLFSVKNINFLCVADYVSKFPIVR